MSEMEWFLELEHAAALHNRIHCCLFYIYANFTSLSLSSIEVYSGRLFFSHVSSVKLFPAVAVLILKILSILFCI
jgi:hypothetical protein